MAPLKSLMQTGFMMWMSGSSVNIFSIMVTGMIIMNTLKSMLNIQGCTYFACSLSPTGCSPRPYYAHTHPHCTCEICVMLSLRVRE